MRNSWSLPISIPTLVEKARQSVSGRKGPEGCTLPDPVLLINRVDDRGRMAIRSQVLQFVSGEPNAYMYFAHQQILMYHLACVNCGATYPADEIIYNCKKCGHLLAVKYSLDTISVKRETWNNRPLSVWRYKELLPVTIKPVTLQEGGTPLYHLERLGKEMGLKHLYAKHEGMNPSGSFKDRGMTVGVSMALQLKKKSVACASTGNTSASLAVYAAKAGIPAVVLLPAGKVAVGKVAQALMHGAKVISIRGNFDQALEMVHELCLSHGLYLLNSINPYRLEGQKTIGFEALDQLGMSRTGSCSRWGMPATSRQSTRDSWNLRNLVSSTGSR